MKYVVLFFIAIIVEPFFSAESFAALTPQRTQSALASQPTSSSDITPPYNMDQFDNTIRQLYHTQLKTHSIAIAERIRASSAFFLNKPYVTEPLGEGKQGIYNQNPLYRTDAFDCVTFVSTVLALVESDNLKEFKNNIKKVRYYNDTPRFENRNHFVSVDWNPNNQFHSYLRDVTNIIIDTTGKPVATLATGIINKPRWYKHLSLSRIKTLKPLSAQQLQARLTQLQQQGKQSTQTASALFYIPLNRLFDKNGRANSAIFRQIPTPSVIEIVRPRLDLRTEIGSIIHVTHMGFGVQTSQGIQYRNASSIQHKVVDIPLQAYLRRYLNSKTVKGINVQQIILNAG